MAQTKRELNQKQIDTFHRQGYVVIDDLLAPADLQPVIDEISREITQRASALVADGLLPETFEALGFERQLIAIDAHVKTFVPGISNAGLTGPAIFDLIGHPAVLDIAELFCGPELIASSVYRLRPKLPNDARGEVPWHQDSGYLDPYCDGALILTFWIPLIDATIERGCLYVLPEAHHGPVLHHQPNVEGNYLEIPDNCLPDRQPVAVPVRKGSVLMFTNRLPHVSFQNTSDVVRWSMDLRYQSAELPTNATIANRETVAAHTDVQVPLACYPPAADFLVRSSARPGEVLPDPERFHQMRKAHRARFDAASTTVKSTGRAINPFSLQRWP
jgi:ectoine hydroxylase-related dioxygenase (phytanoyl-CoA dioxygenase family)